MKTATRLFELLPLQLEQYNLDVCLADKKDGKWRKYSTQEVIEKSTQLSFGLMSKGIQAGEKVAIISENRTEWNFADIAIQQIGAISVPMYPTISEDDYAFIFEHSECKLIFVSTEEIYHKAKNGAAKANLDLDIYIFDESTVSEHWSTLLTSGSEEQKEEMEKRKAQVNEFDLVTIIYTSGTTGRPKGVMLNHKNIISNAIAVSERAEYNNGHDRVLSFLPLCHIFERTAIYFYFQLGLSIYYAESLETISDNLQEIKPHGFNTVPRLIEKIYDKIIAKGFALSGVKKQLFFWAVNLGLKYNPDQPMGFVYDLQLKMARKLIFSKWQAALGGNVRHIIVGASAIQPRLKRVFWAADIKILEGYGLTETSPGISIGMPDPSKAKLDYVGPLLNGVQVKIANDGEILVKGPNVMMGYYKDQEKTDEVIVDGWFHTGDIGELTEENFLRITDRKKEMFKTSGGKYIAPQVMENKLKESVLIEQVMVIGENRKFPAALIVPNLEAVGGWADRHGLNRTDPDLLKNVQIMNKFQAEVDATNQSFGNWEQVKKFEILNDQWGIASGELTPTLKLKRRIIKEKYADLIEKIYAV
ncbi:long-chain fatty acid--CoA ligase [Roseivirga sp.]|uniref:AMP-dependent synthetase/ligase n=1 Tax=Roseivirga sp. TaxID=1964215 RepID=UPI002B27095D|nr:long-chain fatty acid--CoA ligase [Roseivirga sp.]